MVKILVILTICMLLLNIFNTMCINRCDHKLEKAFHALLPILLSVGNIIFYYAMDVIFKNNNETLMPICVIISIVLFFIFLIVNAYVIISRGIDTKKDKEVTLGLALIFLSPVLFIISLPLEVAFWLMIKFRRVKNEVKVTEEEVFEDIYSAENYFELNDADR